MRLTFSHNGKTFEAEYNGTFPSRAKLYAVPVSYSDDGYYISLFQDTEIEPSPGCAVGDEKLLCHVRIEHDKDSFTLKIIESNEGATCHA